MQKLLIIDGNSMLYRGYYILDKYKEQFKLDDGTYTHAVYNFINMLLYRMKQSEYNNVIIVFDKSKKTFRNELFAEYKATRNPMPNMLFKQIHIVKEFLDNANISYLEKDNYEADDIAGSLATKFQKDYEIDFFTSDKDYLQLVTNNVNVLIKKSNENEIIEYNINNFTALTNLQFPKQIIDLKILSGDKSDNIPSVKGISENIARILLAIYKSIDEIFDDVENLVSKLNEYKIKNNKKINAEKIKDTLINNKDEIYNKYKIVRIVTDLDYSNLQLTNINLYSNNVLNYFNKYKFNKFIKMLKFNDLKIENPNNNINTNSNDSIQTIKIIEQWSEKYNDKDNYFLAEFFDENYHTSNILGFGIINSKGSFYFSYAKAINDKLFINFLTQDKFKKYTYNAKSVIYYLLINNIKIKGIVYDMMLAAYILYPEISSFNLYVKKLTGDNLKNDSDIYSSGVNKYIPNEEVLSEFVMVKVRLIQKTYLIIMEKLKSKNQLELYETIEFPLLFVLMKMEYVGIKVDIKELNYQHDELIKNIKYLEEKIFEQTEYKFNINSPKQVSELIYDKYKYNVKSKKRSSSVKILNKLKTKYPVVENILEYRKFQKLFSTYINGMKKYLDKNNVIHTIYKQAYVITGRLSSVEPNMQNIASNNLEQKKVKKIFIPHISNSQFVSFDYSQIELRILAQFSKDKNLISAFESNEDIHSITAKNIFDINDRVETSEERRIAKAVNFGIIYGITDYGLKEMLNIPIQKANYLIAKYFEIHPGVKEYIKIQKQFCIDNHYVKTFFNRQRKIDLNFSNEKELAEKNRELINMPIQGTAADILKIAIINIDKEFTKLKLKSKLILQIHDELIFEVIPSELILIKKIIPDLMTNIKSINNWDVKLKVNCKVGNNLFEL